MLKLYPFVVTTAVTLFAGYFKLALFRFFGFEHPFLLFFAAVCASAWYGGARQGFYALFLSILFSWFYLILPLEPSETVTPEWMIYFVLYAIDCSIIIWICDKLQSSKLNVQRAFREITSKEKSLRESEARLRRIYESNMIGLAYSSLDGTIREANQYFINMLGADPKQLAEGKINWRDFTPAEHLEKSQFELYKLFETDVIQPFEKEYIDAKGKRVSVLFGAAKVDSQTAVSFILDISDRLRAEKELQEINEQLEVKINQRTKQLLDANTQLSKWVQERELAAERLRQSQNFLDSVIENIPNMIFVKDAKDLRFIRFNKAGEALLGVSREELVGKSDFDFFPKEQADFFTEKDRKVLSAKTVIDIAEEPINTKEGTRFLHTKKIPILDQHGRPQYLLGISEDITERKEAEKQKMELLQAQMARNEAEKSAARLTFLSNRANEASQAKSAFLANISHELRTPLGAMLGFAEIALEDKNLSPEQQAHISTILRNGHQLLQIVNEVLDLSKVESEHLQIERLNFSLIDLIEEVLALLMVKANEKGLTLQVAGLSSLPQIVNSDPLRLRQILINVIGNAIKFTQSGSISVQVNMQVLSDSPEAKLDFLVSDTGIGITQEQARKLFSPFAQADESMTRKFGGTGLGLFLSRKLARLLGGDVDLIESTVDRGSQFRISVRLGLVQKENTEVEPIRDLCKSVQQFCFDAVIDPILIVDDSMDNRTLVGAYLTKMGLKFDLAENGKQGIEKAFSKSYSIVLMDIQMPEMDGMEAIRVLRNRGYDRKVIALTAHAMKGDRERFLESGFNDYLRKPLTRNLLAQCLGKHLCQQEECSSNIEI